MWLVQCHWCVRGRMAFGFGNGGGEVCSSPLAQAALWLFLPACIGLTGTEFPLVLCFSAKWVELVMLSREQGNVYL